MRARVTRCLLRDEFEYGIVWRYGVERFNGGLGQDGEEFFDGAGVAVEVFLENGGLFGVGDGLE